MNRLDVPISFSVALPAKVGEYVKYEKKEGNLLVLLEAIAASGDLQGSALAKAILILSKEQECFKMF